MILTVFPFLLDVKPFLYQKYRDLPLPENTFNFLDKSYDTKTGSIHWTHFETVNIRDTRNQKNVYKVGRPDSEYLFYLDICNPETVKILDYIPFNYKAVEIIKQMTLKHNPLINIIIETTYEERILHPHLEDDTELLYNHIYVSSPQIPLGDRA